MEFAEQLQGVKPHQLAVTVGFNEFRGQRKIQMVLKERSTNPAPVLL